MCMQQGQYSFRTPSLSTEVIFPLYTAIPRKGCIELVLRQQDRVTLRHALRGCSDARHVNVLFKRVNDLDVTETITTGITAQAGQVFGAKWFIREDIRWDDAGGQIADSLCKSVVCNRHYWLLLCPPGQ